MMANTSKHLRRLLPLAVLLVAGIAASLIARKPRRAHRRSATKQALLVKAKKLVPQNYQVRIVGHGSVEPQHRVDLSAEVSGRVVWVYSRFIPGSLISKGTVLLRIDPADYQVAVSQAEATLAQVQKALMETQSNAEVARREWKALNTRSASQAANPLTLHKPQLKLARANLKSAEAALVQAQVNLQRTILRAPFNMRVRELRTARGQYVQIGSKVATVDGTDRAEVIIPISRDDLTWLPLYQKGKRQRQRIAVTLTLKGSSQRLSRKGVLDRSLGEVEPVGRMTRVVVTVEDPYALKADSENRVVFEAGAFVEATIPGKTLSGVYVLPLVALRDDQTVWLADDNDELHIETVTVKRVTRDDVIIGGGLQRGDRVILSPVATPANGLKLRVEMLNEKINNSE